MQQNKLTDRIHWWLEAIYEVLPHRLQTYLEQLKARLCQPYEAPPCLVPDKQPVLEQAHLKHLDKELGSPQEQELLR
jgi:hypothetical protein